MTITARLLTLALAAAMFPFMGCSADVLDLEDEPESEGFGETHDELRSGVSCKERTDTAYTKGKASKIQVIVVGGKPVAKPAGHAFLKLQEAAEKAGIALSISSGFRTMAEQTYFYNCYQNGNCNNGNLAAKPGYSNHQSGTALDLTPSGSSWLQTNAKRFGFVRTVPSEAWHFEFTGSDPGGPCSRSGDAPASDDPDDGTPASPKPVADGIAWVSPAQDATVKNGFTVRAHAKTASIVKVVYAQGTFVFGTSTSPSTDFALTYRFTYMGDKTLTVKGYDASGGLVAQDNVDFTLTP